MKIVTVKSVSFSLVVILLFLIARTFFKTDLYLSDLGGLGSFLTVFGTLYGIMAAFVVFEVWNQYNKTQELVHKEAQGFERLIRLTVYFRDKKLLTHMLVAVENYLELVIKGRFQKLGQGIRNPETGKLFRKISEIINQIEFNDSHDEVIFKEIISHYGYLAEVRTARMNQSLTRLPILLKTFLYTSSGFALLTFIVMPFANMSYGSLAIGSLGFIVSMIFQLVEDLDNPFTGGWTITPEPFERALGHIREYSVSKRVENG